MNGIEKITDKILSDALEFEKATLAAADEEVKKIRAAFDAESSALEEKERLRIKNDVDAILSRASASGENRARNILLEEKSKLLDEAYSLAKSKIANMPDADYFAFLLGLAKSAIRERLSSEEALISLEGEDAVSGEDILVILAEKDDGKYSARLLESIKESDLPKAAIARVKLGGARADIDAGLILKCGDIETNCSLDMLLVDARARLDSRVREALFA